MANEQRTLQANFTANASGFAGGTSEAISKLKELNTQVIETKQKIKETNAELKSHEKELANLKKSTNDGATATAEQRKRMQELQDAIARCKTDLGAYATTQQRLQSDIRNTNRELDDQRKSAEELSQSFAGFGDILKANLASDTIMNAVGQLTNMLKTAAANVYATGASFEAGMSRVEAISGASGDSLDALTEKAKTLGATTKFTATQAAEAMNYMAMAGWDAQQMLSGIDGVMGLAAASGEDLGTTADIVTDAITAFGLAAEDVGHFSDVLAAASANANTNVSMLGESFKYVAPLAGSMGYSIDDTAEALGVLANSGIKASTAGTSMRTILTELATGVTLTSEAFGEMEISAANADGSMKPLKNVIDELRVAFSQMNEQEKTANANLFGDRALPSVLALVNAGTADINKLRGAIENCSGAATGMAETMQDNVAGSVTVLNSAVEGLWLSIYDKFSGNIGDVLDTAIEKVGEFTSRIENGKLGDKMEHLANSAGDAAEQLLDLAGDVLPLFFGMLADGLNFVLEFRNEIGAVVTAVIAFKGAMAIGNVISAAVTAIKSFSLAAEIATAKQIALNAAAAANPYVLVASALAALTIGIFAFSNAADKAADEIKSLHEEAKNLNAEAEKSKQEAENISDLADEYKELAGQEKLTADEKERLQEIQDDLVTKYGFEASEIDLVNGKYEEQLELLNNLINAKSDYAAHSAQDAYNRMELAETVEGNRSANFDLEFGGFGIQADEQEKLLNQLQKSGVLPWFQIDDSDRAEDGSLYNLKLQINGNTKQKLAAYKQLLDALKNSGLAQHGSPEIKQWYSSLFSQYDELYETDKTNDLIRKNYEEINKGETYGYETGADHYRKMGLESEANAKSSLERAKQLNEKKAAETEKQQKENIERYKQEKQLADDMYSVGELSAQEYYQRLTVLRDTYLVKGTHEWYVATAQIQKFYDKIGDGAKDTADRIKDALGEVKSEFQKTLDALDAELEKHDRDLEDEETQKKIDAVKRRLEYEQLDDYSRRSLEKELDDLEKERAETRYRRSISDAKETIRNVSANAENLLGALPEGFSKDGAVAAASQMAQLISKAAGVAALTSGTGLISQMAQPVIKNFYFTLSNANKSGEQFFSELYKAATKDHI